MLTIYYLLTGWIIFYLYFQKLFNLIMNQMHVIEDTSPYLGYEMGNARLHDRLQQITLSFCQKLKMDH